MDEENENINEHGKEKERFVGEVAFENIQFEYEKDKPILHGINFTARAGEMVAIVGPTGSGKTTIIQLLTRFYDTTGGRILLDGGTDYKLQNDQCT